MAIITKPNSTTNGTTADGSKVSANFDVIYNDYNGNITDANIAASGITTYGKVNGSALSSLGSIASGAGIIPAANVAGVVRGTFVNSDLSTGVLTVTHSRSLPSPYVVAVQVFNNSGAMIIPDAINTFAANSFKIDLTSYGTLSGTWSYVYGG